jgi:hypothetical protein
MKALGIGGMEGLKWRDFEIVSTSGPPEMQLSGVAATTAKRLGIRRIRVSLAHSRSAAGAVVIAEGATRVAVHQRDPRKSRRTKSGKRSSAGNGRAKS